MSEAAVKIKTEVNITASITFTEGQLAALEAMAGYGSDAFLRAFYVKLGKHYMKPFERDLRDLFDKIKTDIKPALKEVRQVRKQLESKNHD
jgi:hypothetical protein